MNATTTKNVRMMANMSLFGKCAGGDVITVVELIHADGSITHEYEGNVVIEGRQVEYLYNVSLGHFN